MPDQINEDQTIQNQVSNNTLPPSPVGSFNKEAEAPFSGAEVKVNPVETGIEVPQELAAHGVKAEVHDRIDFKLDTRLASESQGSPVAPQASSNILPFKLLMPEEEAQHVIKAGFRNSGDYGMAMGQVRAKTKFLLKAA